MIQEQHQIATLVYVECVLLAFSALFACAAPVFERYQRPVRMQDGSVTAPSNRR